MGNNEKYALITGATSGIGYELARLFAKDGYNLVIVARDNDELNTTAKQLRDYNVNIIPLSKDLFKKEAALEVYNEVIKMGIEVNTLVNDAGQGQYGEFVDTDIDRELDIIQLNIAGFKDYATENE